MSTSTPTARATVIPTATLIVTLTAAATIPALPTTIMTIQAIPPMSMTTSMKMPMEQDTAICKITGTSIRMADVHLSDRSPRAGRHGATVELEARILEKNDLLAARNRAWFAEHGITALNLLSSPGAGKTTLLERTILDLRGELPLFVIEGDQATTNDGERIRAAGAPVVQINTGAGCHLEADMVAAGLKSLGPPDGALVLIENVGNLVCPAMFDLGERAKVVIFSVTEGEDKPLKYPHMFRAANILVLTKIDLLPHLEFDMAKAVENAQRVNPAIEILSVSAKSGAGLASWYDWLRTNFMAPSNKNIKNVLTA
jgi:hydrogenase nickel incorporation protein HypB